MGVAGSTQSLESNGELVLWSVREKRQVRTFAGHSDGITDVTFSNEGRVPGRGLRASGVCQRECALDLDRSQVAAVLETTKADTAPR